MLGTALTLIGLAAIWVVPVLLYGRHQRQAGAAGPMHAAPADFAPAPPRSGEDAGAAAPPSSKESATSNEANYKTTVLHQVGQGRRRLSSSALVFATALATASALGIRAGLQPVFGDNHPYTLSFLAVLVTAYLFGRTAALGSAAISGLLAFYSFTPPTFAFKAEPALWAGLGLYWVNSAVATYLITKLMRGMADLKGEQQRLEGLVTDHAVLFRDLNRRVSRHMRLVSGVLALQARGEPDPTIAEGLRRAGDRTLLLARADRELEGPAASAFVDFEAFAQALMRVTCVTADQAPERVVVAPARIFLPPEEATSLGVALVEAVTGLLERNKKVQISIVMTAEQDETRVTVRPSNDVEGLLEAATSSYLLRAMVEQLGARMRFQHDRAGPALELGVPHIGKSAGLGDKAGTLH